jgi:uncharacterized protein YqhQ
MVIIKGAEYVSAPFLFLRGIMAEKKFYYGGQAVIEGVMMRGKQSMAIATRHPNGEIGVSNPPLASLYTGFWRKTPLVRGIIAMIESMVLGIQTLMYSANVALEEEKVEISGWKMWGIIIVAMAFAVGVFFFIPLWIASFIEPSRIGIGFNLIEGVIRVILFILYLYLVSRMKDIRRVFAYHGAEHKSINTYEAGDPLEVEYARKYTTANPRCGTSFLFAVLIIAILVFSVFSALEPNTFWIIASRIILLPVIAALAYEFIYFTSRHCSNPIMKILIAPGMWLQKLTTREPDDKQLEVALAALKSVLQIEQPDKYPAPVPPSPIVDLPVP